MFKSPLTNHNPLNTSKSAGFTLIEALVAVVIIGVLSTIGVSNVVAFQKDAKLESFASVFSSTLELAKNKSVNGETPLGYVLSDFEKDSLPYWVVDVQSNKYSLYSNFTLFDGTDSTGNSEDTQIVSGNSITPTVTIEFERLTGATTATCFNVQISGYSKTRKVYVDDNGNISNTCP